MLSPDIEVGCGPPQLAHEIAEVAVWALIEEAELTPKPALVDMRGPGAHRDLDVERMRRSARSLRTTFARIFAAAFGHTPSQRLRDELAAIGRAGESAMMRATGGSNAHRGAIWSLGLLVAGTAMACDMDFSSIALSAARIAMYPSSSPADTVSNGQRVCVQYGVKGARGEAQSGFPHVVRVGLPRLRAGRSRGLSETDARLDALMAIMTTLPDTCLLHRGGETALAAAQQGALQVLQVGGCGTAAGRAALDGLHRELLNRYSSPGGSADMLTGVLFLDRLAQVGESLSWK